MFNMFIFAKVRHSNSLQILIHPHWDFTLDTGLGLYQLNLPGRGGTPKIFFTIGGEVTDSFYSGGWGW